MLWTKSLKTINISVQKHQNGAIYFANYHSSAFFFFFTKMGKSCYGDTIS